MAKIELQISFYHNLWYYKKLQIKCN